MNEQLNNTLAEAIKASKDGVINLALFAQQQAPDLAKEIIQWGFWSNLFWSIASPLFLLILWKINLYIMKEWKDNDNPICVIFWIVGGLMAVIFIVCTFCSIQETIKCAVSPKLYLMDYIKDFVASKK